MGRESTLVRKGSGGITSRACPSHAAAGKICQTSSVEGSPEWCHVLLCPASLQQAEADVSGLCALCDSSTLETWLKRFQCPTLGLSWDPQACN